MLFLIKTLFDLYIFIVLFRFLLQLVGADFYNPVSQAVVKLTNPLLQPIQRFVSGAMAPFLLLIILQIIKYSLLLAFTKLSPAMITIVFMIILDLIYQVAQLYFYMILIVVLMSWLSPMSRHPVIALLEQLTEPLLRPARRLIPIIGGLDFSPVVVLIALRILMHFVSVN